MSRPLLLDLFCGAGGAAMGYHQAGFDIVGVDIVDQPYYPFTFVRADALTFDIDPDVFDVVHASPPCQSYSGMSNRGTSKHPRLIAPIRERLVESGLPYVIENVRGAGRDMIDPVKLIGEQFDLRVHRMRLFEMNWDFDPPPPAKRQRDPVAVYGKVTDGRLLYTRKDGSQHLRATLEEAQEAMEMHWADWHGTKEAVPPAFTRYIGRQLYSLVSVRRLIGFRRLGLGLGA